MRAFTHLCMEMSSKCPFHESLTHTKKKTECQTIYLPTKLYTHLKNPPAICIVMLDGDI